MTGPGLKATKRQRRKRQFKGLTQAIGKERDIHSGKSFKEHLAFWLILQMRKLRPQEGKLLAQTQS